jgi:hypothetical protein
VVVSISANIGCYRRYNWNLRNLGKYSRLEASAQQPFFGGLLTDEKVGVKTRFRDASNYGWLIPTNKRAATLFKFFDLCCLKPLKSWVSNVRGLDLEKFRP